MFHLMAVHGARVRAARRRTRPTACASSAAAAASASPLAMRDAPAAVEQRGVGARPGRGDPLRHHARARPDGHRSTSSTAWPRRRDGVPRRWSRSTRTAASPTACSSWPGRTARWCCASSTRPRPTRSSTRGSPAPSIYSQPTLRADAARAAAQPARPVGPVGLCDLRRPADRAAADRRGRQHRPRAPAGAGARLVAPEGPGGRPRDLERGARRLPAAAAGADPRPDRRQRRSARGRPARRHLRAPRRADRARGPRAAAVGGARRSSATAAARWPSRSTRKPRAPSAARRPLVADALAPAPQRRHAARARRAGLLLFNGIGGFTRRRPRVRDRAAGRRAAAGAVGQRDRQPALRHRRVGSAAAPTPGARTRTSCA